MSKMRYQKKSIKWKKDLYISLILFKSNEIKKVLNCKRSNYRIKQIFIKIFWSRDRKGETRKEQTNIEPRMIIHEIGNQEVNLYKVY